MKKITLGLALAFGLLWQTVSYAQTVTLGKPTTLRAQSSSAQSYEWTFPGGVVINGEVVQYTFTEPGVQEVKLKVTDQEGNTNEIIKRILVANNGRPTAIIETTVNGKVVTGNVIEATLEDSIALKSNSFAVEKTAKDFTEIWSVNGRNYSVDSLPSVFDKIGTYSVKLAVQDPLNSNQQDQASVQVKINNMPPVIKSVQFQPLGNSQEQFQVGVEAEDPDGTLSTYKFEALEAGKTMMTQVVESNITVFDLSRFPGAHTYNFRVTVSDDRFLSTTFTDSKTITVDPLNTNTPPEVTLQVLPGNQAYTGEAFDLKASATDADNDSLKYEWISSDGRRSSSSAFQLVFSKAGKYSITLNVSDGLATTTEKLDLIVLEPEVIELQNTAPEVEIYGVLPADTAPMNSMFRFYLKANDADEDRLTYEWDFGNGAKSFTQNAAILYNLPGDYTVTVKVSDGIETVTDEVRLTVELGPNEIYYESVEDRLVDLQSERQRILDAIAANGGEITPAQQAQLQALNNDIADLVGQARTAGDFTAIKKLEEISRSLDLALLSIEAEVVDGMTLTELGEKLKEEQSEEIKAIEDEADILAEIDAEIKRVEAERVKTVIDNAVVENDFLKTNIAELNDGLRKQKADLIIELEGYRAAGDTLNATRAADRLAVVNGQIDQAIIDTGLVLESVTNSRTALETEKADLEMELKRLKDAGDTANATRAQDRLDVVNGQINQAIIDTGVVLDAVKASREMLETEKFDLEAELDTLRAAGDTANATRVQERLDVVNRQIDQAIIDTGLVLGLVTASRTELETDKTNLEADLRGFRAAGDTANATRAQEQLDLVNARIDQAIIDTGVVLDAVTASRTALETEKTQLEADLTALRAAGNTANATRAQERLDVVNGQIEQAIIDTDLVLDSVTTSRQLIETQKTDLEAEVEALRASGDTANANRAQEQLDLVNARIDQAVLDTGLILESVAASRELLETEKTDLRAEIETLKSAGNTANAKRAQDRLEAVNSQIEAAQESTLQIKESLDLSRESLAQEKINLKADLELARSTGDQANQARLEARAIEVNDSIVQANEATVALLSEIEQMRLDLEAEQADQLKVLADAKAAGSSENTARAQARLTEVNAQLAAAKAAQAETQTSIDAQRTALEQSKEDLYKEYAEAKAAGNEANVARVKAQIIETEEMLASLSSKSSEEYYAEQRAKYEARKTSVELVISELEKAEKSGKTVDQFTAALQTQADTANPNSDEFKSAAGALEQQALINRAEFLGEQIDSLEALAKNPTELPPLGVDRQSNETLEQRLDRIENQAERASIEAAQRQNAASQIAAAKQAQQIELLRRLESELAAENDQGRRTVLSARIGVLEKEIAQLEQIKNPNEVLSSADIAKRVAELTAAAATTNDIVITEQQAFIATRLAELQVEIDLAADPRVKADLEAQKKRLEANLNQTGILTDYEAQLKASQKALNERLATDLNTTAELLVQTQLNSVETKLGNLEK